ncbi:MAG: hypothetical protein WCC32_04795 [Terriglobales bacterium]
MKIVTSRNWFLVGALAILCFAPYALSQETADLTFTGGYSGADYGIATGPYTIQVNGGATYNMICDDYDDEIYDGSTWTATANTYANLSHTLWGGQTGAANEYANAITLAYALMFNTQGAAGSYTNNMIQFAVWAIFDPSAVKALVSSTDWSAIQGWISWAQTNQLSAGALASWIIWTPGCTTGPGTCGGQEFFQYVPEGGAALAYMLLAGIACFGAMFHSKGKRAMA